METPATSVVVVGDGLLAFIAAARLAQVIGGSRVRLVPDSSGDHGLGPCGPTMVAPPRWLAAALAGDRDDADAVSGAATGWVHGIGFRDWTAPGSASFWSFGDVGAPLGDVAFHQLLARWRLSGKPAQGADFSLPALAARGGRGCPSASDPRSPLSSLSPGLMLSADRFAARLRDRAIASGVALLAPLQEVRLDKSGHVAALALADGTEITATLFVDCTGDRRRLIDRVAPGEFRSWRSHLPCDRVATVPASTRPPQAFVLHRAEAAGWSVDLPAGTGWVTQRFASAAFGGDGTPFDSGAHHRPWTANVVALGAAAILVEPLHALPLAEAGDALALLAKLLPITDDLSVEAEHFNRVAARRHARLLDLAQMPYSLNRRHGEPLWDAACAAPINDELANKIALFESRGRVSMLDDEPVDEDDWIWLLDIFAASPRRVDPLAAALPLAAIEVHLGRVRERLAATVRQMPPLSPTPQHQGI